MQVLSVSLESNIFLGGGHEATKRASIFLLPNIMKFFFNFLINSSAQRRSSVGLSVYFCHPCLHHLPSSFTPVASTHSTVADAPPLFFPVCSVHPVDWNNPAHPRCQREPRRGQRAVLRATVAVPLEAGTTPLAVYCAHFEVFCGMLARIAQLSDVFEDVRKLIRKV